MWLLAACGTPTDDAGIGLRLRVHTAPPPDDVALSPLRDTGVTGLELRDAQTNLLIASGSLNWRLSTDSPSMLPIMPDLNLGLIEPFGQRDLRLSILGTSRQVLGQAVARTVNWDRGQSTEATLELRRQLAFFGGGKKLLPLSSVPNPVYSPARNLAASLADETKLRVLNPSSVDPFLTKYNLTLDPNNLASVTAVAGTFDGQSLLVATTDGNLHIVDTLLLQNAKSISLLNSTMRVIDIVVDRDDKIGVLIEAVDQPPAIGLVGQIIIIKDLSGLRSGRSDGDLLKIDIQSTTNAPMPPPLAAAFSPDGQINVLFSKNSIQSSQPDCVALGVGKPSVISVYEPSTGNVIKKENLTYTAGITFTTNNERILVQPCVQAPGATRSGQIVIERTSGAEVLSAPGVLDAAPTDSGLLAVGRDDYQDAPTAQAYGTVYKLDQAGAGWAPSALFYLPEFRIPYRITLDGSGNPYSSSVDIVLTPSDFHVYRLVITPDRTRAIALSRATYKSRGVFISTSGSGSSTVNCFLDSSIYGYNVMLINLQVGAPEYSLMVGLQMESCSSRSFDSAGASLGPCFTPCDQTKPSPYLIGFQSGYIPTAAGVMFGRK